MQSVPVGDARIDQAAFNYLFKKYTVRGQMEGRCSRDVLDAVYTWIDTYFQVNLASFTRDCYNKQQTFKTLTDINYLFTPISDHEQQLQKQICNLVSSHLTQSTISASSQLG